MEIDKIYNGDCLELMKEIPDKSVDCIICDLPYGVTQNKIDIVIPFKLLWEQYNRVAKKNAAILLFAQGLFYVDVVMSNRQNFRYDLVWDKVLKTGFLNANRMPLREHEQIAVFYRELPTYNPQMSEGKPLHGKGTAIYQKETFTNNNYGEFKPTEDVRKGCTKKYPSSIIKFQKPHPSGALHPTEKSVELLRYLVRTYTNEGDTVLDNCMGSGTTAIACIKEHRHFIGFELNKEYFDKAERRIKLEQAQLSLF